MLVLAFSMAIRITLSITTKPNPQWPLILAVVGDSFTTSKGAPGTM